MKQDTYLKYEISGKNYQYILPFSPCFSSRLTVAIKKFSDKAEQKSQKAAFKNIQNLKFCSPSQLYVE